MIHSALIIITLDLPCMKKKQLTYKGDIDQFPSKSILINVNNLSKGKYVLKIIYRNRVIKKTTFKK